MAYYRFKAPPQIYRGFFKHSDVGKADVDLGLFTKKEEGLAWTRVFQMLATGDSKAPPSGKIEFTTALQKP